MVEQNRVSDRNERREAIDSARSFIVQAPAGSGKTALLIQRFLRLLSYVSRPEEVLAITFTRKAASEMHERILEALQRAAAEEAGAAEAEPDDSGEDEHSRATLRFAREALLRDAVMGWGLLKNPARLQVQTIDSFCASLSKRMPLLSRLGANLAVSEKPGELYAEAARRTLKMIGLNNGDGAAVRQILKQHDNSIIDVEKKLVVMLGKREQWLRHTTLVSDEKELRFLLEASVVRLVEEELSAVAALVPSNLVEDILSLARYAASGIDTKLYSTPIVELREIKSLPGSDAAGLLLWRALAELLLTQKGEWRKPKGVTVRIGFSSDKKDVEAVKQKESFKLLLGELDKENRLLAGLHATRSLPDASYTDDDWSTLEALLHLLPTAVGHLREVFRLERAVDFSEISMAAISALGPEECPTDLMLSLDNTFSHILVDEYQDTSWTQVTLLRALTRGWEPGDGRTLFIVGDPMQSIYLFRDAEVGLFLDARRSGIGTVALTPLTLRSNFRSDARIVEWVNRTFKGALPITEDLLTGAVVYEESVPYRTATVGAEVEVKLYPVRSDAKEADDIVTLLGNISATETRAVLARSRSHLDSLVPRLKAAGIDFQAEEFDPLKERPAIQDLFALTRALFHPGDRVSWLALLRGRWCGLSLADLHRLCLGDRKSPMLSLIRDERRFTELTPDGRERLARFVASIERAFELRGRVTPRELLEGLWIALGGPACYEDVDSLADADLFFDMIEPVSLGGDLSSIDALESLVEGLYARHAGAGDNPVLLMTIHKAKGLEFDHVILPGLGRRPRGSEKKLLYWMERGEDLLLAPIEKKGSGEESKLYKYLEGIRKEKERLEAARLFYVAATRAKKRLYLFGSVSKFDGDEITPEKSSFLGVIRHGLDRDMVLSASVDTGVDDGFEKVESTERTVPALKRLPIDWQPPEPVEAAGGAAGADATSEPAGRDSLSQDEERLKYDWATITASYVGTVVHACLSRIAAEGVGEWNEERLGAESSRVEAELLSLGINVQEVSEVAKKALGLIANALDDVTGRWVLGGDIEGHKEAKVEWALSGLIDESVVDVVIDRTFVDIDGVCWIIDYKTGRHEGGSVEAFISAERSRHQKQLDRYERVVRGFGEVREIKKALYYPALKRLVEL